MITLSEKYFSNSLNFNLVEIFPRNEDLEHLHARVGAEEKMRTSIPV